MKDGIVLTEEFVNENKAELACIAKSLFGMTNDGYRYPSVMSIKTDFGCFAIVKQGLTKI